MRSRRDLRPHLHSTARSSAPGRPSAPPPAPSRRYWPPQGLPSRWRKTCGCAGRRCAPAPAGTENCYVGRREAGAIVRNRAGQANAGHQAAACIDAADCPGEPTAAEADAVRASRPPTHRSLEAEDEQSDPHDERKSKKQEADLCTLPEEATRRQQSDSLTGNYQAGRAHEHRSRAASASRVKQPQFRMATFGGA